MSVEEEDSGVEKECKRMPGLLSILIMVCQMEIHLVNGVIGGISDLS